jgi:hypothetical protein
MTNRFKSTGSDAVDRGPGYPPQSCQVARTKRESLTFVYVLAAEDVGKFPDRKMNEAFSVLVA